MLVYSVAKSYEHLSIPEGQHMLRDIAKAQGFEVTIATDNSEITDAGLAKYEIVFFMNSQGDIFNNNEQKAFETWIQKNGAFAGTHSATDTENTWAFYKELTGQYYDQHDPCCSQATVQWEPDVLNLPMVKGLPNPWLRSEEWYKFGSYQSWSGKSGFKILSKVTTTSGGTRPVSYIREWGNFRSFYTSIGHEAASFQDANVKKHITAGIMWAVRREDQIK
jgi:type 1 glutamine amidotransferase